MEQWSDRRAGAITVPLVAQLTDDDRDGRIDASDVPDIITVQFTSPVLTARLVAHSGDDGRVLFEAGDGLLGLCSFTTLGVGDLDGDGTVEIVAFGRGVAAHEHVGDEPPGRCTEPPEDGGTCPIFPPDRGTFHDHGRMVDARFDHLHMDAVCSRFEVSPGSVFVFSHRGELERTIPLPFVATERRINTLLIADLDADGRAEIIAGGAVIDAAGVRWSDPRLNAMALTVGDIDLDGRLEIVTARHVFEHDGTLRWSDPSMEIDAHPVIARVLEASSGPQIIVVDGKELVVRDGDTGSVQLGPVRFSGGISSGPPTVADFDGDGVAEVGVAADHAYVVFDFELAPPHVHWEVPSADRTPGTVGSAAFDFDSDGAEDVAYADECHVRILSGRDGAVLWAQSNPSMTVWEYPVAADVDGDGHAELVVVSNGEGGGCLERETPYVETRPGLRVFRDRLGHWGPTRRVWSQHGYAQAIDESGRVAVEPPRSWRTHNSVRANPHLGEPGRPLPNLRVTARRIAGTSCDGGPVVLEARVENRGNVGVPAGIEVAFGAIGLGLTRRMLLPGGAEWVRSGPIPRAELLAADALHIRADPRDVHPECGEATVRVQTSLRCAPSE